MLSQQENALLTRVGPGTPCGELLRRYWHPIAAVAELTRECPTRKVRILGEELVLFRDGQGGYGLLAEHCSHRGTSLYYGYVEDAGIRCCYHGWLYDKTGRCLEQPFEPNPRFKETIRHRAYPIEELGGLLFAYMGPPDKKPLLPRWDILIWKNGRRTIYRQETLNCNWFQAEENSADVTHTYFLHAWRMRERARKGALSGDVGKSGPGMIPDGNEGRGWEGVGFGRPFARYGFQPFKWGLLKSWVYEGESGSEGWGNLLVFPNILRITSQIHWRVPIDDTRTEIIVVHFAASEEGKNIEEPQAGAVEQMPPQALPNGEYTLDGFFSHDKMAWETQGAIADRRQEYLSASDRGITLLRRMLKEQIEIVRGGGDPMGLVWDPAENVCIDLEGWENEGDLRSSSYWRGAGVPKRPKEEVFDEQHESFGVPYGAARPRTGKS